MKFFFFFYFLGSQFWTHTFLPQIDKITESENNKITAQVEQELKTRDWVEIPSEAILEHANFYKDNEKIYSLTSGYSVDTMTPLPVSPTVKFYTHPRTPFGKTEKTAFFEDKPISNVDIQSFQAINNCFAKDKKMVYSQITPIRFADPVSFSDFQHSYSGTCRTVNGFAKDKNHVYYLNHSLPGADPQTFSILSDDFGADAGRVYYLNLPVSGADLATFDPTTLPSPYAKDKSRVYYGNQPIQGADVSTFEVVAWGRGPGLSDIRYAKDKNYVYYLGVKIQGADSQSFQRKNGIDAEDKYGIIDLGKRLGKGEKQSVQKLIQEPTPESKGIKINPPDKRSGFPLDPDIAQTDKGFYYAGRLIEKVDVPSFQKLGDNLFADKNAIYFKLKPNIDLFPHNKYVYLHSSMKRIEVPHPFEFKVYGGKHFSTNFVSDGKTLFENGEVRQDIDLASFRVVSWAISHDKNYIYYYGLPFIKK